MGDLALGIYAWIGFSVISSIVLLYIEAKMPPSECLTMGGAVKCIFCGTLLAPLYVVGFLLIGLVGAGVWLSRREVWSVVLIGRKQIDTPNTQHPRSDAYLWMEKEK